MKRTIRININSQVFNIDEDAFQKLESYINELNQKFENREGGNEIISDIEARIAELFKERLYAGKEAITLDDVDHMIGIMGLPEDYDEEDMETEHTGEYQEQQQVSEPYKKHRNIYRDIDNKLIAGVCSGIAAYFNIEVIIVRVLFIVLFFVGYGALAVIYILLWLFVPPALTTAQKLEMKGEKVNVSSIEKAIKDELSNVKQNIDSFTKSARFDNIKYFIERFFGGILKVFGGILKFVLKFAGFWIVFSTFVALTALAFTLFFSHTFLSPGFIIEDMPPVADAIGMLGTTSEITMAIISIFFIAGIPLFLLLFVGLKMMVRFQSKNLAVGLVSLAVWLISISLLAFLAFNKSLDFKTKGKIMSENTIELETNTIYIKANEENKSKISNSDRIDLDNHKFYMANFDGEYKFFGKPKFDIKKASGDEIKLEIMKTARGKNRAEAEQHTETIIYNFTQEDSVLILEPMFFFKKNEKFRSQEIKLILRLPEGKMVHMDNNMEEFLNNIDNMENYWDYEMTDKIWMMQDEGLSLKIEPPKMDSEKIADKDIEKMKKELTQ